VGLLGAVGGGALVRFITGGLVASLQRTRLGFLHQRFESELLSTEKVVRLLSRTTVIENGIRFGSGQMVEAVLNHCIRGETQIAALAVWDIQSGALLSNTVSPSGAFHGTARIPFVFEGADRRGF
jgi:hypothetical protein